MDRGAEIGMLLAGLALNETRSPRDWSRVLSAIRTRLDAIGSHPKIAADDKCRTILLAMCESGDMVIFARHVDELAHRVAWLFRQDGEEIEFRLTRPTGRSTLQRVRTTSALELGDDDDRQMRPRRGQWRL